MLIKQKNLLLLNMIFNVGRFVPESLIFSNRDDALDWAIKITDEL